MQANCQHRIGASGGEVPVVRGGLPAEAVSILVADASRIGCQLLSTALGRSCYKFNVVASAVNSAEVLAALKKHEPHVAVISANLQDGPLVGFNVLREFRALQRKTRIIMLCDKPERDLVLEAFRGGAKGVFSREEPLKLLCKCINKVSQGQLWMSGRELQFILEALAQSGPLRLVNARGKALLTKRQEQVVRLVAEGLRNSGISRELGVSEHTVKNYLFQIFDKLGVSSRTELVLYAVSKPESPQVFHR